MSTLKSTGAPAEKWTGKHRPHSWRTPDIDMAEQVVTVIAEALYSKLEIVGA